jgi:cytochrome bd ubiquinol oxidase subunit II
VTGDIAYIFVLFFLGMYVLLDGYDFGIGILLLLDSDSGRQREMVEIVATAWDGNESWIILLGVTIWAAFPGAYGTALPALFLPLIVMLFAIIWRGVAIEMASASPAATRWRYAFGAGSLVAALAQGMVIGGLLSGVRVSHGAYAGHSFGFFTAYAALTGLATVLLYATTGAAVLQLKSTGELRRRAAAAGRVTLGFGAVLILLCAVSMRATAASVHLSAPGRAWAFGLLAAVGAAALLAAGLSFGRLPDSRPIACLVTAQVCGLTALAVATYPVLVPPGVTIGSAVSPPGSLDFLLVGVGLNIPLVLFYNWYAHHVFRGKYRAAAPPRAPGLSRAAQALTPAPAPESALASPDRQAGDGQP